MAGKTSSADRAKSRQSWVLLIKRVLSQIENWAQQNGWPVHREQKDITEDLLGTYSAPVLQIKLPSGCLYVEPVARYVVGAEGRIDLYSWPALHRLLLVRAAGKWALKTDSRIDWPEAWGKRAFINAAENLTSAVNRWEVFDWIKTVDGEYRVALLAVSRLRDQAGKDPAALRDQAAAFSDIRSCWENLEGTYTVRLFAEFESALRIYWRDGRKRRKRTAKPMAKVLIDRLAAYQKVDRSSLNRVHEVREYRNRIVHEQETGSTLSFGECRSYLGKFLSYLPLAW